MLQELQKCPCLFATTLDNIAVMARMSADATSLVVWATLPSGKSGKAEFNATTLLAVKERANKGFTWERFFDELQTSFNNNKVSCKGTERVTCELSIEGEVAVLDLQPTTEDGQSALLDALLNYQYIHSHSKEAEKQLEEATKKEHETRIHATELEREEQALLATIARSKEQDEINHRRIAELDAELAAAEKTRRSEGGTDLTEDDEESVICRVRIPLYKKDRKDLDIELLRLVKSKWVTAAPELATMPCHSIVHPYTTSELAQHTTTFTSTQREKLWTLLQKLDDWDYDVFSVQTAMSGDDHYSLPTQPNGGSLLLTFYALMIKHNFMQKFKLDEGTVLNWISCIEAGYHGNPYHNSMHAADVLHITNYILNKGGMIKKMNLTDEDVFAALFAATIHDYDHPGINNSFHTRAQTYLSILYNDRSILENRHVSSVMELMKLPKFNIFAPMTEDQRRDMRETIIEMILATDMGIHGKFVQSWKRRIAENHDLVKRDDVRLALSMAIKMADISNCGRPTPLYLRWGKKIADEFYMQGDRERTYGLACSPFMDRNQPAMGRGQIAFMNYVVVPLFESIADFLPDMHFAVEHTEANKSYWVNNPDEPPPAPAAPAA